MEVVAAVVYRAEVPEEEIVTFLKGLGAVKVYVGELRDVTISSGRGILDAFFEAPEREANLIIGLFPSPVEEGVLEEFWEERGFAESWFIIVGGEGLFPGA